MTDFRLGIDLGGTKAEIVALDHDGRELLRRRRPTPHDYDAIIRTLAEMVQDAERERGGSGSVGIGFPGAISPATGLVKNASLTSLIGHKFDKDLGTALGRAVHVQNDAKCFALSEAVDGAGKGQKVVFGAILGTGVGGGIVIDAEVLDGRHRIAGEWGHTSLPWPKPEELPGPHCWCGQHGCIETFLAGPWLAADCDGPGARDASDIPDRAAAGDAKAQAALARHAERLGRALAMIVNIIDPDVIVLGGGLSNLDHLYTDLPGLVARHVFGGGFSTPILRNVHGDSSGVRGAAWLWPDKRR